MKKLSILFVLIQMINVDAQINFGKPQFEDKALMDFALIEGVEEIDPEDSEDIRELSLNYKGIILPIIELSSTGLYTDGTFAVDKNDKKIKIFGDGEWLPLSDEGSFDAITDKELGKEISTAVIFNTSNEVGGGVVIGTPNSNGEVATSAEGVLVLEAEDQALILPRVPDPHLNIASPVAGTMCYDTVSKSLAIFDGVVWNYWK